MKTMAFYFDYRSPYGYLAWTQFGRMPGSVDYRPMDIVDLMRKVENVPTSVICSAKNRYVGKDLARWARRYGVPFARHPDAATIDARRLLRATLAAQRFDAMPVAVKAIYEARWASAAPLSTADEVAALLGRAGLDAALLAQLIDDPALDQDLDAATDQAAADGVFGAPTFFVDDEMFFGNDRLDFVCERLGEPS